MSLRCVPSSFENISSVVVFKGNEWDLIKRKSDLVSDVQRERDGEQRECGIIQHCLLWWDRNQEFLMYSRSCSFHKSNCLGSLSVFGTEFNQVVWYKIQMWKEKCWTVSVSFRGWGRIPGVLLLLDNICFVARNHGCPVRPWSDSADRVIRFWFHPLSPESLVQPNASRQAAGGQYELFTCSGTMQKTTEFYTHFSR